MGSQLGKGGISEALDLDHRKSATSTGKEEGLSTRTQEALECILISITDAET